MYRDFSFEPEVMEVLPHCDLLFDKLIPVLVKGEEVLVSDR
jgi:hypothetical protein